MTDTVTVRGFVATSPSLHKLPSGTPVTNFRVASTPRWYDAQQQTWKEGTTNWYQINSFRALAQHANRSIFVGQPVIVTGRLNVKQWSTEDGRKGTNVEIDATAIGHDLNLGTSSFNRAVQPDHERENTSEQAPNQSQHSDFSDSPHASEHEAPSDTESLVGEQAHSNPEISALV